ncbi:MAG: MFS transporter, partial [Ruthenibacterium sp.]
LGFTFVVYFFAFAAAGLVTPGLQQMTVDISPKEHRGAFFARKDIVSACVNSAAVLVMGRQLDYFSALGQTQRGYWVVGLVSLLLAAADAAILGAVHEQPAPFATKVHLRHLAAPLRDAAYRPILLFLVCGGLAGGISASFLPVHLLRGLQLSHTFITSTGVFSALVGMLGTWVWGQLADRTTWNVIVRRTALISGTCTLGWFFITPAIAPFAAPLLLAATAGCGGAGAMASLNLQYAGSPPAGKTTYLGVTSALSSIAGCCAVVAGTALQPMLQMLFGARSVPILFLLSAVLLYLNLFLHAGKLPQVR